MCVCVVCSQTLTSHERYADLTLESIQLAINFLFNTFFRTKRKLR